jgi:hypothetical protein
MTKDLSDWAQSAVGGTLDRVEGKIYEDGAGCQDFEHPHAVRMQFLGASGLTFFCHSDGETLAWNSSELSEVDLGEYGKELVIELADRLPWSGLIAKTLTSVSEFVSPGELVVGYEFIFEPGGYLLLLNLGDELAIFDRPQERIFTEEAFLRKLLAR